MIICVRDHIQTSFLPLTGHLRMLLTSANMFPSSEQIFFIVTFCNPFVHDRPGCTQWCVVAPTLCQELLLNCVRKTRCRRGLGVKWAEGPWGEQHLEGSFLLIIPCLHWIRLLQGWPGCVIYRHWFPSQTFPKCLFLRAAAPHSLIYLGIWEDIS